MSNFEIVKLALEIVMLPIWCYFSLVFIGREFAKKGLDFGTVLRALEKNWGYFAASVGVVAIIHSTVAGATWQVFSCALLTAWALLFCDKVIYRVRSKLALAA